MEEGKWSCGGDPQRWQMLRHLQSNWYWWDKRGQPIGTISRWHQLAWPSLTLVFVLHDKGTWTRSRGQSPCNEDMMKTTNIIGSCTKIECKLHICCILAQISCAAASLALWGLMENTSCILYKGIWPPLQFRKSEKKNPNCILNRAFRQIQGGC